MTNKAALISMIGFTPSKDSIDRVLISKKVDGSKEYDGSDDIGLTKCAIKLLELLLSTPNMTNDVGLIISYDRNAVKEQIYNYKVEVGEIIIPEPKMQFVQRW